MTHALHRLIYVSSSTDSFGKHDLDTVLAAATRNNAPRNVTGLLLYHDGNFFQVLEGAKADVDAIFAVIRNDRRHGGVIVLSSRPAEQRAFPRWSMGYIGAHALHPHQRDWLVDLNSRLHGEGSEKLSTVEGVNLQIDTFLSSFREFAAA